MNIYFLTLIVLIFIQYSATSLEVEAKDLGLQLTTPPEVEIKDIKPKIGSIGYFKDRYGSYPPKEPQLFKVGQFILITLDKKYGDESQRPENTPNKKQECELIIRDGQLLDKNGTPFTTNVPRLCFYDLGNFIWVLSKKGKIYVTKEYCELSNRFLGNHHSFILKSNGYGKPIAGGGAIKGTAGKITEIDCSSGHYKPNTDQLLLAAHYFYTLNLLAETVVINNDLTPQLEVKKYMLLKQILSSNVVENIVFFQTKLFQCRSSTLKTTYCFADIANINPEDILSKYKELV